MGDHLEFQNNNIALQTTGFKQTIDEHRPRTYDLNDSRPAFWGVYFDLTMLLMRNRKGAIFNKNDAVQWGIPADRISHFSNQTATPNGELLTKKE